MNEILEILENVSEEVKKDISKRGLDKDIQNYLNGLLDNKLEILE